MMSKTIKIKLQGVSSLCAAVLISRKLSALPGVKSVWTSEDQVSVEHDGADEKLLFETIKSAGPYRAKLLELANPFGFRSWFKENILLLPPCVMHSTFPPNLGWIN